MKFLSTQKKLIIPVVLIIFNILIITQSSRMKNTTTNTTAPIEVVPGPDEPTPKIYVEVNNLINRGYSLLADQSSIIERPASCLGKFDIFEYKFDVDKMFKLHTTPGDLIIDQNVQSNKGQKIIKEYTVEEIVEAQKFAITGDYKLPNSNFLYQRARSVRNMNHKKTVLYFHERVEFTVEINNKTDFPKLSPQFLADALHVFDRPEVKSFDNQEEYVREGFAFLYKYGTHYIRKSKWGSRTTLLTELKLEKADMTAANKTSKTDTNVKSGQIGIESDKNKMGNRFYDFDLTMELGNCFIDTYRNEFKSCDKNSTKLGLVGYDVDYLYNLFNAAAITAPLTLPDKSTVTPDKVQNIQKNLKKLIDSVENSLYVKNSIVSDFVVFNNLAIEDKNNIGCLEDPKTKRFHQFKNSMFSDEFKVDKLHPVFKLTAKDFVNYYDLALITKKKLSSFACLYKKFNMELEDIYSPQLFNREFINGIIISSNTTMEKDKVKAEDCTNLWVGGPSSGGSNSTNATESENSIVTYLCLNKTTNFLDANLITDVKVKTFPQNKCAPFEYNDRKYECLCDKELVEFSGNKKSKTKRYICFSKKEIKQK